MLSSHQLLPKQKADLARRIDSFAKHGILTAKDAEHEFKDVICSSERCLDPLSHFRIMKLLCKLILHLIPTTKNL